jgi:acetyltransferase
VSIEAFFKPSAVAVIGASTNPNKLGYSIVENLVKGGYLSDTRKVYPINPKPGTILGLPIYPSVQDVPGPIDLAVIVIPDKFVYDAMISCGEKGIKAVVIISAGFRESGREGLERELKVIDIAKQYGIRIVGPNCLGVIDTMTPLNASFSAGSPPKGPMAFMSQSGALGTAILDWAMGGELGLSKFVSLGNKADIDEADLLRAWADDPASKVILAYIEALPDGQEFIKVAREVSKKKPIIAVKSGITQAGARAVVSHTGSLAGSEQAYQAAFRQAGVIRANSLQDMFDYARAFGYLPPLKGDRIAIVTNAGGPGILATDALERSGLKLARFENECIKDLEKFLPDAASAANPVDVIGDARSDRYSFAIKRILKDPHVDGMLVILTPQAVTDIKETAQVVVDLAKTSKIPIMGCWMGQARVNEGSEIFKANNVPNCPFPERAAKIFKAMSTYRQYRAEPIPEYETLDVDKAAVRSVFDRIFSENRLTIGDYESREIMKAYKLPIPEAELAASADEAAEIATKIGFPVVLKIASPDILHKTDVGGVKVDLKSASEVHDAFDMITYRAKRYVPDAKIWGCIVQQMVPDGLEILIGMNQDPQFGPLVTFGLGGIFVEVLKDVSFRIAPFSRREAEQMIYEIRTRSLLEGVRGKPPADKKVLIDIIMRVGQLVTDFPEIAELDINPFILYEENKGGFAIDMRLVLKPKKETAA